MNRVKFVKVFFLSQVVVVRNLKLVCQLVNFFVVFAVCTEGIVLSVRFGQLRFRDVES